MAYDAAFFDLIRAGSQSSAAVVVPLVLEHYRPQSVVDVGCGEGWWGKAFQDDATREGCEVLGLDGEYAKPVISWAPADLEGCVPNVGTFDLAVCLEVAEHLVPAAAEDFIAALCQLAPVILFSAAIPGQSGNGHLNCRWPSYWVKLFEQQGHSVSDALRWQIWDDDRVEPWYRQNLLVAAARPAELPGLFPDPLPPVRDVVHPVIGGWSQ